MDDQIYYQRNKNRLKQIVQIIKSYDFSLPLNVFLRNIYLDNKNMGSNDRRHISNIFYQYLRLGTNLQDIETEKKIGVALFLCNNGDMPFSFHVISEFTTFNPKDIELPLREKFDIVMQEFPDFMIEKIFPLSRYFSKTIDKDLFIESNLFQPKVWIRIKRGKKEEVIQEIKDYGFDYAEAEFSELCFSFIRHYPLHQFKNYLNGNFEIQDAGSQLTGTYFKPNPNEDWWDVCAGSGGKSLMLIDEDPTVSIYATDIRKSVLENLKIRFSKAGFHNIETETIDVSNTFVITNPYESFDGIILDAPCTGSGTWAAIPENLSLFDYKSISEQHHLQTQIGQNVLPYLKKGKPLIYITCSVYKQENEDAVKFLCDNFNLHLESQQIIEGYKFGASTFFVARMIKKEL